MTRFTLQVYPSKTYDNLQQDSEEEQQDDEESENDIDTVYVKEYFVEPWM